MQEPLVSILTPVFNGEKFIHRLLDSILIQDYPNIEYIIVDDGSTDKTKDIIEKYISKFHEKNISFIYLHQENKGQSFATKHGLNHVNGEYLTLIDSDDYYCSKKSISTLVEPLLMNSYKISRGMLKYFDEKNHEYTKHPNHDYKKNIFEDSIFVNNNFWFGCYMIDFNEYKKINPNMYFYCEKDTGQNWQLLLPLLYNHECFTINEYLLMIFERSDSHSRGQYKTAKQITQKYQSYINTLSNTLKFLDINEKKYMEYMKKINKKYIISIINASSTKDKKYARSLLLKNIKNINPIEFSKLYIKTTFIKKIVVKIKKLFTKSRNS